ncbi:MAG: hypothetical protein H6605_07245 [Flavobacteriales bacterium]|nr:hypothetical protein [Flavobacteriales bacterium]
MLYHISKLHRDEQELIKKAPLLVSILISNADGKIEPEEIENSVKLIHIKSFSEASDIRHLYKEIDHNVDDSLRDLIKGLPSDAEERESRISKELEGLNPILRKLEYQVALDLYKSLKNFAFHVAQSSGGIMGMNKVNDQEKELIKLPMLEEPVRS